MCSCRYENDTKDNGSLGYDLRACCCNSVDSFYCSGVKMSDELAVFWIVWMIAGSYEWAKFWRKYVDRFDGDGVSGMIFTLPIFLLSGPFGRCLK